MIQQRLTAAKAQVSSVTEMMDSAREIEESLKQAMDNAQQMLENAKQTMENDMKKHETAIKNHEKMMEDVKKNHESARKNVESVRETLDRSLKEEKAAEAQLNEAEKRWEVVNVDDEISTASSQPKRRKVSVPPSEGIRAGVSLVVAPPDAATATVSSSSGTTGGIQETANVSNAAATATIPASNVDESGSIVEVVLKGCGLSEVNGIYKRSVRQSGVTHVYRRKG